MAEEGNSQTGSESPLTLEEILAPLTLEEFLQDYWGKRPFVTELDDDLLERVSKRFCDGRVADVVQACRKDDNTRHSPEEVEKMESDLADHKTTLNLPFCFCEGAEDIRFSFIEGCSGYGNDVEVGVYFSQTGGQAAAWHFDNNHNITIQVQGEKDWQHIPGDVNTVASRGMLDLSRRPKNRHDQQRSIPPIGPADCTCYNLQPGSVIYLPPGHWHSVTSVGADFSFSVDLRVGNLLQSKWIAESLFAGLLEQFATSATGQSLGVGPADLTDKPSDSFKEQVTHACQHLGGMLDHCRPLRAIPFEAGCCNGLHRGATLDFVWVQGFSAPEFPGLQDSTVGLSSLVSMYLKRRGQDTLVLELYSESTLSTMEYLHFSLICDIAVYDACEVLARRGQSHLRGLLDRCTRPKELTRLILVLAHANVLFMDKAAQAISGDGPRKRRKRNA